jgi:secreted trypsin-like serine protease
MVEPVIVGGTEVPDNSTDFLWLASLQHENHVHFCGGNLISPTWILTAAHCCWTKPYYAVLGTNNLGRPGVTRKIKRAVVHEFYKNTQNDIALLELESAVDEIEPVRFADRSEAFATIAGWGVLNYTVRALSVRLREATVPIQPYSVCTAPGAYSAEQISRKTNICAGYTAGGTDTCQGDSGGPLLVNNKTSLIGVVSWGWKCAEPKKYGVYTNVLEYKPWIDKYTGKPTSPFHTFPPQAEPRSAAPNGATPTHAPTKAANKTAAAAIAAAIAAACLLIAALVWRRRRSINNPPYKPMKTR